MNEAQWFINEVIFLIKQQIYLSDRVVELFRRSQVAAAVDMIEETDEQQNIAVLNCIEYPPFVGAQHCSCVST
ncbi:MAG: hypothetical protein RMY34_21780 [Aulosira sp. DedQUE10]|nr:hypothetical protein [Aulosira sp. DedQUE10]